MFSSESEMHQWLREQLALPAVDGISDLIANPEYLNHNTLEEEEKILLNSFRDSYQNLHMTEVLLDDQNISYGDGVLRPDFVLYSVETEAVCVVELKNFKKPTREAGTEIGAYTNELKSHLPFLADGDVINVIISTEWPTLLTRHIRHEIIWLKRKVICLEPAYRNDGKICLKVKDVSFLARENISHTIDPKDMGGFQICLYDNDLYTNRFSNRLSLNTMQMVASLHAMSTTGNSLKAHGCAFLWKDMDPRSLAPYSITLLNISPFNLAEKFIENKFYTDHSLLERNIKQTINNFSPSGHSRTLTEISEEGIKFLERFCSPRPEGYNNLKTHSSIMKGRAKLMSFRCWGVFNELHHELLDTYYTKHNINVRYDCPYVGTELIEKYIDDQFGYGMDFER